MIRSPFSLNGEASHAVKANADSLLMINVPAAAGLLAHLTGRYQGHSECGWLSGELRPLLFSSSISWSETIIRTNSVGWSLPSFIVFKIRALCVEQCHRCRHSDAPTAGYNCSINIKTLASHNTLLATLPSPISEGQKPPVTITAQGYLVERTTARR
jgi:hypothetical protein